MRDSKSTKTRIFVGNKTITLSIEKTDENISTEQRAKSVIKECLEHGQFRATELYNIIGIQLKLCSEKMCYKYLRELEGIGDIIKTEHNKSKVYRPNYIPLVNLTNSENTQTDSTRIVIEPVINAKDSMQVSIQLNQSDSNS